MTNIFVTMTEKQAERRQKLRLHGRKKYVIKKTLLCGAIIPALILWGFFQWTSFANCAILLLIFSVPVDYALARMAWVYQEYRYRNYRCSNPAKIAGAV